MQVFDDYTHPDPKITYVSESFRSSDVEDLISGDFVGCQCVEKCESQTCSCLQNSGAIYEFLAENESVLKTTDPNKPIYECNDNCKCVRNCGNRLVQFTPRKGLYIQTLPQKGSCLFTKNQIEPGTFICEYAGEIITSQEAKNRFQHYSHLNHNYIFCVSESFGAKNIRTFIDPTFYGNIGRYINHSCEPNSLLVPIRINDEVPKLCIFAHQKIAENCEITFSYGTKMGQKKCHCLTQNCKGFLPCDNTH